MQGEENVATTESRGSGIKLEVGKRYVMRCGYTTNAIRFTDGRYPFNDGTLKWSANGHYTVYLGDSPFDIVSEYIESASEPLRWVENCKPDKPGLWARKYPNGEIDMAYLTEVNSKDWDYATRCYLGPIPTILPPPKKVVQRLWLKENTRVCRDAVSAIYDESWIDDDSTPADGCWIRTCKTREVEQ